MATTCPDVISWSTVIQLSRHFSNSAGSSAAKMALNRSCDGIPSEGPQALDFLKVKKLPLQFGRQARDPARGRQRARRSRQRLAGLPFEPAAPVLQGERQTRFIAPV